METIKRLHPKYGLLKILIREGQRYYSFSDIARIFGYEDLYWVRSQCSFKKVCINPNISIDEAPFEYLYMHEIDAAGLSRLSPDEKRDEWLFGKEESKEKGEVKNMNEVQVFNNAEFGDVRVVMIDGDPWFVGKDIATALGYSNTKDAIWRHVNERDKRGSRIPTTSGEQEATVINESGFYSLIFSSKLPKAQEFKYWVTSEVLPTIRKHGAYMTPEAIENALVNPDFIIKLATKLKEEQEARKEVESKLEIAAPKADYYDEVLQSKELLPITAIAKDYGWSSMKMNHYLENRKVQYKKGRQWFLYQNYADKGYTMSKTFTDGAYLNVQTYWTQKGRKFIYDLLASEEIFPVSASSERMV